MTEGSRTDLASILAGPVVEAARRLLGTLLVRDDGSAQRSGRIVEVEAYAGPADLASHARFGRTARNATMFGRAGLAYVYGVYGMHTCLNVVCGAEGFPAAILVRAAEPVSGVAGMRAARIARSVATRRVDRASPAAAAARVAALPDARLASGPGNVGAAFSIGREDDGCDLLAGASLLRLEPDHGRRDRPTASGPRIGVAFAGPDWGRRPWRFWIADSPAVSGGNVA